MAQNRKWLIGANMLSFGNVTSDGTPMIDAPSSVWASQLRQVKELGVDYVDPTDAWLSLAELSDRRLNEFSQVLNDEGLGLSSISMTRNSIVDKNRGIENFKNALRLIEIAPVFNVDVVNIGFMQDLTPEQKKAIWFWLAEGHHDDPALRELAIERTRQLGDACKSAGIELSLEMYEDTFIGSADDAVSFITDVDHGSVGLNPDIGNFIRLHRKIEPWRDIFAKVLPYTNFWHIKNYTRDYDPKTGAYASAPVPLKYGYINYREVIRNAVEMGYTGVFCCEHYGSDSLGVIAENAAYISTILRSQTFTSSDVPQSAR